MSYRHLYNDPKTTFAQLLHDIHDRIYRLENGGALRGEVSFEKVIRIGNLQLEAVDDGPDRVNVVLTNVRTGSTVTIPLDAPELLPGG